MLMDPRLRDGSGSRLRVLPRPSLRAVEVRVWGWRLRGEPGDAETGRVVIPEFAKRMSGTRLVGADGWVPDRFASGMTVGWGSTCGRRPAGLRVIETSQLSALPAQAGTHGGWVERFRPSRHRP